MSIERFVYLLTEHVIMRDRTKAIMKYYNNLEYNASKSDRKKALMEISALAKKIKPEDVNNISNRLLEALYIIKKNFCLFESACGHVDVVSSIMQYLCINEGLQKNYNENFEDEDTYDMIQSLTYTFFIICPESEMQLFFGTAIMKDWSLTEIYGSKNYGISLLDLNIEMILLQDTDLYAVISHLRIIRELNLKILVQEPIIEEFSSLLKRHIEHMNFSICTFRSKQEILIPNIPNKLNMVSIWSEDIITAKCLARSLTHYIVFINTYMDFYSNNALDLRPEKDDKDFSATFYKERPYFLSFTPPEFVRLDMNYPIYNLFYNGTWYKSVQNKYVIHNNWKGADGTKEDFEKCVASAQKGYEIWSNMSTDSRKQILLKFAFVLKCDGKFQLSKVVEKYIKFVYYDKFLSFNRSTQRLEISLINKPTGIIYIMEEDEISLFQILTQSLILGNSVIVICAYTGMLKLSHNLFPYCDMFSTSGIPRGVVNVISTDRLTKIYNPLNTKTLASTYMSLTNPRMIILPLR